MTELDNIHRQAVELFHQIDLDTWDYDSWDVVYTTDGTKLEINIWADYDSNDGIVHAAVYQLGLDENGFEYVITEHWRDLPEVGTIPIREWA